MPPPAAALATRFIAKPPGKRTETLPQGHGPNRLLWLSADQRPYQTIPESAECQCLTPRATRCHLWRDLER